MSSILRIFEFSRRNLSLTLCASVGGQCRHRRMLVVQVIDSFLAMCTAKPKCKGGCTSSMLTNVKEISIAQTLVMLVMCTNWLAA